MEKRMLTPKEIAGATINAGVGKSKLSALQMIVLGIFAGAFIAFGAQGAITIGQTLGKIDVGLGKFAFAAAFPVGLMLVVICGAELFTGNNLMFLGVLAGKYGMGKMLRNWIFVYIGNFIGSIAIAAMVVSAGLMNGAAGQKAVAIATAKVGIPAGELILRAMLCNILVVLAVWLATGAKDVTGKIFACWFPIMLFVLSGYEHSIANMFFIPVGKFIGAEITWGQIWMNNVIPVTIGNILGGAVIVPVFYYLAYVMPNKAVTQSSTNAKSA